MRPSSHCLDLPKQRTSAAQQTRAARGRERGAQRAIVCARCGAQLTDASQRIAVLGQHQHTFFNPAGVVFHIACFASVPGCRGLGPFSDQFTWFPGHRWQIALCAGCGEHLGWHFEGGATFTSLIEARIREADA
jgi:hypothetical protein